MVQFLPLDKSAIISTSLEAILYGFSVLMFIGTLWVLLRGRKYAEVNRTMVLIACSLFTVSSIRVIVDIKRVYTGLIVHRDDFPGGPAAWFENISDPSFVFKNVLYGIQTLIGDGVVIYRCYMVWRSFWVILFPLVVYAGLATTVVGACLAFANATSNAGNIFAQQTADWITGFYSITLSCNLTATALLAYRLWSVDRSANRNRVGRGLTLPVLLIVVDAGALYSLALIAALTCFALKSNGQFVVVDMITPIISIAFYMVILRIGIAAQKNLVIGHDRTRQRSTIGSRGLPRMPLPRNAATERFQPMHVHIQVDQLTEGDGYDSAHSRADKGQDEV
ncbi:hypothetical protein FB451DRAFT_1558338 [Mycena latifolia]|nr:hypothetical protein FB451DRAFT_1558338 [Mycena latifolia]